jgi:predicted dehydrogenase
MNAAEFVEKGLNRRQFLGSSAKNAAGVAAGMVGVGLAAGTVQAAAHEQVHLGVIGVRGQGKTLAEGFAALPDAQVVSVCDVDENIALAAARSLAEIQGRAPKREQDFRRLLDDQGIDAVVIATPDHWHALMTILACQAGKDVYVEKPVSHNLLEGERMIAAMTQSGRVVGCGLQQRSGSHFRSAIEYVKSGKLGQVHLAKAWSVNRRKTIGFKSPASVPEGVDYDLWLGPADKRDFQANRFHHNWHWFWDYGTGELGNWGVHMLDLARWGLNVDWPERVTASGGKLAFHDEQETPDTLFVNYQFAPTPNAKSAAPKSIVWEHRLWTNHGIEGRSTAVAFYGERGTLILDRGGWKVYGNREAPSTEPSDQLTPHLVNFLQAIKTGSPLACDLPVGHVSSGLCHLGNIAHRTASQLEVDPARADFGLQGDAAKLLTREYRSPWELPEIPLDS